MEKMKSTPKTQTQISIALKQLSDFICQPIKCHDYHSDYKRYGYKCPGVFVFSFHVVLQVRPLG